MTELTITLMSGGYELVTEGLLKFVPRKGDIVTATSEIEKTPRDWVVTEIHHVAELEFHNVTIYCKESNK